jgi:hypothetical protein
MCTYYGYDHIYMHILDRSWFASNENKRMQYKNNGGGELFVCLFVCLLAYDGLLFFFSVNKSARQNLLVIN